MEYHEMLQAHRMWRKHWLVLESGLMRFGPIGRDRSPIAVIGRTPSAVQGLPVRASVALLHADGALLVSAATTCYFALCTAAAQHART